MRKKKYIRPAFSRHNYTPLIKLIEEAKILVRGSLSTDFKRDKWDSMNSQDKKIFVFYCWDKQWITFHYGTNKVVNSICKHFDK